jgi:hypothetical protein
VVLVPFFIVSPIARPSLHHGAQVSEARDQLIESADGFAKVTPQDKLEVLLALLALLAMLAMLVNCLHSPPVGGGH